MVWSLSKDDDGLDSVLPAADTPLHGSAARAAPASTRSPSPSGAPTSVVVDPISQMPEGPHERSRRRGVEATQILKGRRLDALRAEVAQKRRAYRRRQQRTLLLWGLAGGAALCLGWIAGHAFSPEQTADAEPGEPSAKQETVASSSAPASADSPAANPSPSDKEIAPSPPAGRRDAPAYDRSVVTLEDLPLADEFEEEEAEEDQRAGPREPGAEPDDDALSLEDLPAD